MKHVEILDRYFPGKALIGLCQYNCNVVQDNYLRRSLSSHNAVVVDAGSLSLKNTFHRSSPAAIQPFAQMLNALNLA